MCGIVGLIAKHNSGFWPKHADLLAELIFTDTLRGADSTGVFGVTKAGNVSVVKGAIPGYQFIETSQFDKFKQRMGKNYTLVVGHNRKATRGDIVAKNAHPFQHDHITLVHNGTLYGEMKEGFEVDSHQLTADLAKDDSPNGLAKIRGAFALAWYNQKTQEFHLARNEQRPMFIAELDNYWAFCSEHGMLMWVMHRNNERVVKPYEVAPNTVMTFDMTKTRSKLSTRNIPKIPYVAPEVSPHSVSRFPIAADPEDTLDLSGDRNIGGNGAAIIPFTPRITIGSEVLNKDRPTLLPGYGHWKKDNWVVCEPDDYVTDPENPRIIQVIGKVMTQYGTAVANTRFKVLIPSELEDDWYKFDYIEGQINLVQVPPDGLVDPNHPIILRLRGGLEGPIPTPVRAGRTLSEKSNSARFFTEPFFNKYVHGAVGCKTCQKSIPFSDLGKTLVVEKTNGGYTCTCQNCLEAKKPNDTPALLQHTIH